MNGVHDMGGMQDMGPIPYARDEPVFHEPWEGRVFALNRALGALRKWNLDASRHQLEQLRPGVSGHELLRKMGRADARAIDQV